MATTRSGKSNEPSAGLFQRLRLTLALWYSAILALALAITGITLYFVLREQLLEPLADRMYAQASFHGANMIENRQGACSPPLPPGAGGPNGPTPPPRPASEAVFFVACFDAQGSLVTASREPRGLPSAAGPFPDAAKETTLLTAARRDGQAWDLVDAGPNVGTILRGATAVRNSSGQPVAYVIASQTAEDQLNALTLVRNLLIGLGSLSLLIASGGGWLMANRALVPSRLAFARQQAFISDASHELRTPLTLLRANAEMLLRHRERIPEDDAEILDDIVAETDNMSRLAGDLLTLARLDAGKLELEREVVDLTSLAETLARRVSGLAHEKRVTVHEESAAGEVDRVVFADAQYVQQAGLILVENAVKYTPAGGTVTLSTARRNGHASLVVQDTGIGIPKDDLNRLGERFYRGDASRTRATGGTGLGLAIAFRIAKAHGGAIQIESEPGEGTRVTLSLPAATI
jgi:signal transduction histidine kinase